MEGPLFRVVECIFILLISSKFRLRQYPGSKYDTGGGGRMLQKGSGLFKGCLVHQGVYFLRLFGMLFGCCKAWPHLMNSKVKVASIVEIF